MRGGVAIVATIFIALAVVVLYFFLGRAQITKRAAEVELQSAALSQQLVDIEKKRKALPGMLEQLPAWRQELAVYKRAVPATVQDDDFLAGLAEQLAVQDVKLLSVELIPAGKWLGEIGEAQAEELEAAGIDVEAARQVLVAHYSINLIGEFDGVLAAFESLKSYRRLYSIDQVTGPAGRGAGTVAKQIDPNTTPIQITGRVYYGIPDSYLSDAELIHVFTTAVIAPRARAMVELVNARGQQLLVEQGRIAAPSTDATEQAAPTEPTAESADALDPSESAASPVESDSSLDAAAEPAAASGQQRSAAEVATT